ncbi:protocadherin Fat 4-like [Paramacrobiotus metropolitanus]|uniref:protocadherin Fat 4-like n=1 Tax=Paramacrobiotus metropolitanus TaxID=2943436 RepID=UPI00244582EB|nr:protocadherin Fat 4-like [Paramacrobiotus metropolitanus]
MVWRIIACKWLTFICTASAAFSVGNAQVTLDLSSLDSPIVFPQIILPSAGGIEIPFDSAQTVTSARILTCGRCFQVAVNTTSSIPSIIIRRSTESIWQDCERDLSDGSDPDPIKYCDAGIAFYADSSQVGTATIRLYVNRQPQVNFIPDDLSNVAIAENSLEVSRIAEITVSDPDELSFYYRDRRIEIDSCESNCPWKLQAAAATGTLPCNANNISCDSNFQGSDTYILSLIRELDYEATAVHQIFIRTTDAIGKPKSQQNILQRSITVRVTDVQDTPPQFVAYQPFYSIDELLPEGTHLFSVKAIDGDRGQNSSLIYYELCQTDSISGLCADVPFLNISTNAAREGEISVQRTFAIEDIVDNTIIINITAVEDTLQQDRSTISARILVLDVDNHKAEFFLNSNAAGEAVSLVEAEIEENSFPGSPLQLTSGQQILIQDKDQGINARFKIYLDPNDTFDITPTEAQGSAFVSIRVKDNKQLDAEITQMYNLTIHTRGEVTSEDDGPKESSATVRIALIDVNDHSSIIKGCSESQPINITVDELVFITRRQILLEVGQQSNITDSDYDLVNRNINTTRFRLYQFEEPNFAVSETGSVEVVGRLDFETSTFHQVFVETDNVGRNGKVMTSYCVIGVTVTDANDEMPELVADSVQPEYIIPENIIMDFPEIQALDKDTTASLTFTLRLDRAQGPNGAVVPAADFDLANHTSIVVHTPNEVNTTWRATIKVIKEFDREITAEIQATLIVQDVNADPRLSAQIIERRIIIRVEDENDNAPKLFYNNEQVDEDPVMLEIAETASNVTYTFTFTDDDSVPRPSNFSATVSVPSEFSEYSHHFQVTIITAQRIILRVIQPFDWLKLKNMTFSLIVYDDGQSGNMAVVSIFLRILDRNNNRPNITFPENDRKFLIRETTPEETLPRELFRVTAIDLDSDEFLPLSYRMSLINAPDLQDKVTIDSATGQVSLVAPVDREEPVFERDPEFLVFLTVIDNANSLADSQSSETIRISFKIEDINDNIPVFANDTQDTVLLLPRQNAAQYELPFRLNVRDADAPDQCGFLTYSLTKEENVPVYLPSENSPVLRLNDAVPGGLAEFTLNVFDGSKPNCGGGHTVSRKLTIKILQQENLYTLTIAIDTDAPGTEREKSEPATAVDNQRITSLMVQNQGLLSSVGVVGITSPPGPESEGLSTDAIIAIVLGVFLALTLIVIIVYAVEKNKLQRKLKSYRAMEDVGAKRQGPDVEPLPDYVGAQTKINPLFDADGNAALPVAGFPELESDSTSDIVSETASVTSSGTANDVEDLEAVVARTNRQNLNNRLR